MDKSAITFTQGREWWLERVTTSGRERYPRRILVGNLGRERVYVPERTCRNVHHVPEFIFECSECGAKAYPDGMLKERVTYCPRCGARVVIGDD